MGIGIGDGHVPGEHDVVPDLYSVLLAADQQAATADRRSRAYGDLAQAPFEHELASDMTIIADENVGTGLLIDAHIDRDLLHTRIGADVQEPSARVIHARV